MADAVNMIQSNYGGKLRHKTGHSKSPFVAYEFAGRDVQIGIRLNTRDLTMYIRKITPNGRRIDDVVPGIKVKERYDG